ncbi:guanine nucleotide exchange factor C9orf72 homolog isoform X2 [Glandiceps talaboti]
MLARTQSPFKLSSQDMTTLASVEDSPLHGVILSVWDNILGPKIQHTWLVVHPEAVSHDILNYASGRVLNSSDEPGDSIHNKFFVLSDKGIIVNAIVFSGQSNSGQSVFALSLVLPSKELSWYMPIQELCTTRLTTMVYKLRVLFDKDFKAALPEFRSTCVDCLVELLLKMRDYRLPATIDVNHTVFAAGQENQLDIEFVRRAIASHLQTSGCSIVIGNTIKEANMVVNTLGLFLSPSERLCSCYVLNDATFLYQQGLYVQAIVKDSNTYKTLNNSMRSILTNRQPTSLIDVSTLEVKQTPPWNEHYMKRDQVMCQELQCLWQDSQQELLRVPFTTFQTVEDHETLIHDVMTELHPGYGVREAHIEQFLRILDRKALTMIKYIEEETNQGTETVKPSMLKRMRHDLNLTKEGDWKIVLATAEKHKPGIYSFICGDLQLSVEPVKETATTTTTTTIPP